MKRVAGRDGLIEKSTVKLPRRGQSLLKDLSCMLYELFEKVCL